MLKLLFKVFAVAFVIIGFSFYAGYLKTGYLPWRSLSFKMPEIRIPETMKAIKAPVGEQKSDLVYKWRDENGGWNYTTELPPTDVEYELISINPNTNMIAAAPAAEAEQSPESENKHHIVQAKNKASSGSEEADDDPPLYSPEGVKKLMDDAKNVQNLVNDQAKAQRDIINQF